ncbi:MAG: serine/threonine protein kinase [Candidatus Sulfotelmatobacter sp.]|nr:serine/threonine protein kinase [Candidatus Sulfotelmatobacter sp.]
MPGPVISHYRVLEKIGSGAMGDVFRARDERLGRDVALKLIRPASSDNPDHLRRFELEARAAAALNHPNIVAVYDVGLYEGTPYIVCELLEGATLRTRLAAGALPVRLAIDYSLQIVQGLIAAHDRHIIHRDLKPENLFITADGRVKILDFGVAKLQSPLEESDRSVENLTTVTKTGAVIGTVAYMSPEQLRGKTVDHRSDIFSVGAILYEMLTGRRAFRGETEVDTITAILREDPPESNLDEARIPVAFQQIIRHCLEKNPENRFQSARDLAFALDTLANASGGRLAYAARRRGPAPIVPWAFAGILLIATALLVANQWRQRTLRPSYRRLTFEAGTIYSARFSPDFQAIVYGAAWNGKALRLFSTVGDSLLTQPLEVTNTNLLAISRTGELAVSLYGTHLAHLETRGMLARAPLAGGSPREVLEDVSAADWDANGELAVIHHTQGRDRIEYPIGHTLYQSNGWISHLRFSPKADKIAFMDHPVLWDDRGSVGLVDLTSHVRVLSPEWISEAGLGWSPDGKEVWFTGVEKGLNRDLLAVNMSGQVRRILDLPIGLTLEDVAPDGRVLVSLDAERLAMATAARDGKAVDLSWHDWNIAKDISRDGGSVLFEDSSEAAGANYSLAIRKIDGTPPVQLGEGSAGGLSPDGKWAISILPGKPGQVKLVPIGPGQPRIIALPNLEQIHTGSAHFLADGKRITLNANEPGHGVRCYLVNLDGGVPVPITPEGITGGLVSPDGRYVLRLDETAVLEVYSVAGGAPRPIPNLEAGFIPLQWSPDDSAIYGYGAAKVPIDIYKVKLATGEKTLIQQLQPETMAGVVAIAPVVITRDGSRSAYSYYQVFSVLYLISGLR